MPLIRFLPRFALLAAALLFIVPAAAQTPLEEALAALEAETPELRGLAIWVEGPAGRPGEGGAIGQADPDGRALTADTPVRIASNTKTYVAAAYLRLWESGRAPLDEPIAVLIDPEYDALLRGDGYATGEITPRHLLMHNSGMPDHADGAYVELVFADPARRWTRREQIGLLVDNHDPLGPPGAGFHYSDSGYVLLGQIIERRTGQTLAAAVRDLLDFEGLGLSQTWWEQVETPPAGASPRAHQYLGEADTHDWNGSFDLYGGGGLISSPRDMARFMAALFRGEVFEGEEALALMMSAPGQATPEQYRLGVFFETIDGRAAYSHSGFWGTYAVYVPALDIAVAGVTLDQSRFREMRDLSRALAAPR